MLEHTYFQYYAGNIKETCPLGYISLSTFIQKVHHPKPEIKHLIEQIRQSGPEEKAILKTQLYFFTPCVIINGKRNYASINKFTGLLTIDFDKLHDEKYATDFKTALFNKYPFIVSAWKSSSGKGVRALISIPQAKDINDFKAYFKAVEKEFQQYKGFDIAPKNCVLPLFYSYDPEILHRNNPVTFTDRIKEIPIVRPIIYNDNLTGKAEAVERITKSAIDKIFDNGHPQLRAIAYATGGYVAAGYISEHQAIELIHNLIYSNAYLSIKPEVYKKTAVEMIQKGQNQPLQIENKYGRI
jgi:hypothetical protein